MTIAALILAAGRGTRAGGGSAKQWRMLAGNTVIGHTLHAFTATNLIDHIVVVLHPEEMERRTQLEEQGYMTAAGGGDRAESVRNGLAALADTDTTLVLIHDVARACVSQNVIKNVITTLDNSEGAAPALPVTDALWTGSDGFVIGTHDRNGLYRAQTPQGFVYDTIRAAHKQHPGGAADDVEVARAAGMKVAIVPGEEDNLKITYPDDFDRAERILRARHGH